jgi:hypothetical protein
MATALKSNFEYVGAFIPVIRIHLPILDTEGQSDEELTTVATSCQALPNTSDYADEVEMSLREENSDA